LLKRELCAPLPLRDASLDSLKLLAMVLMVVDHINLVCFEDAVSWMFYLGRGSFPLFAFVMACHLYRDTPLVKYVPRLVVFALVSQPVFVVAFQENTLNILFTLALGAVVASWVVGQPPWRLHVLCWLALSSIFFEDAIDFDLVGIMLPALLVSAMKGERFAQLWSAIMLLLLNLDVGDVIRLGDERIALQELSLDPVLTVASTALVPWVSYTLCRHAPGGRFVPRYALYWFYPGHLLLLVIWRWLWGDLSLALFWS